MAELVCQEAVTRGGRCASCQGPDGHYRCLDCLGEPDTCATCCRNLHVRNPFHRIKKWNGLFLEQSDLSLLSLVIHLGHGGDECPSYAQRRDGDNWSDTATLPGDDVDWEYERESEGDATILEKDFTAPGEEWVANTDRITCFTSNGVFYRRFRWCQCPNAPSRDIQMFRMRFFSASIKRPSTVFTFEVLDDYHIDAMECKTAASNYANKIRRKSNPAFPSSVPVSDNFLA